MEWILFAGAAVAGVTYLRGRRRRNERADIEAADLALLQVTLDEDVTALGEDLQQLDSDMLGQPLDESARLDYRRALDAYDRAKEAAARLRRPEDATPVSERLADGRYGIACVQARVAGRPRPERRPPCFFDPRHGPSHSTVRWAPPGGTMREVPACALDAERVREGTQPPGRKVLVGTRMVPYWRAGPAFRPMATGYFGADMATLYFAGTGIAAGTAAAAGVVIATRWDMPGGYSGGGDGGGDGGGGDHGGGDGGGGGGN